MISLLDSVVLGVVEGLTEFLPVSSTAHLTITERLLGLPIGADAVTGFTAVIQTGAVAAVLLYFGSDIITLIRDFLGGLRHAEQRSGPGFQRALCVLVGSIPIGIIGLALKDVVTSSAVRSLVTVALGLIVGSIVFVVAEARATQHVGEKDVTVRQALLIGLAQGAALVPGVSRSGATISAGLLLGLDRVSATRLSFLLSVPALVAAGLLELGPALGDSESAGPLVVGTLVSFVVALASIRFLLRFVAGHSIVAFVPYRVALGTVVLLVLGVMAAT